MAEILVTRALPSDILRPLLARGGVEVWEGEGPIRREVLLSSVGSSLGVLSMLTDSIDAELLEAAPRLMVVSQMAAGVDNIDLDACARRRVRVGHTPGVLTETVADTAFALMASIVRRLPEGKRLVEEGRWGSWSPFEGLGGDLHGLILGIVGMGGVGRAVARRASGFEMRVIYTTPRAVEGSPGQAVTLDELLATADVVMLCAPLTEETRGMIGVAQLEAMRPISYLVNVARGQLVDTDALMEALGSGSIAGAALDVIEPEPLPPDHPILSLPNCLVTPHIASASVSTRRAMAQMAVDNLIAGLDGTEMPAERRPGG